MPSKNTISDKIKDYIIRQQKKGLLNAGDKLPSYFKLCEKFGVSYASVQYAFRAFEKDGLVERVQGVGTFLKGKKPLNVELYLNQSSYPAHKLEPLLKRFLQKKGLHLNVKVLPLLDAYKIKRLNKNKKVVIVQDSTYPHFDFGGQLDLSVFTDYKSVVGQLKSFNKCNYNVALPFSSYTFQMAYNPHIMEEFEIDLENTKHPLDWWNKYIDACKQKQVYPAQKRWDMHALWSFNSFTNIFFPLIISERNSFDNLISLPFFDTESGRRMLEIMKSHKSYFNDNENEDFLHGKVGVDFSIGSWISIHASEKYKLLEDNFKIIPYRFKDKIICSMTVQYLKPFIYADIKLDEKMRVWELLKMFVSKEFQIELCGISGSVSIRKDIKPEEHPWNIRKDFSAFFPRENDIVIYSDILNDKVEAALGTLYEQYDFFGVNAEQILKSMDKKVESMLVPT